MSSVIARPFSDAAPRVEDPVARSRRTTFGVMDLWSLLMPAMSFIVLSVGGQLIISEVLMLVMLPWLWGARDRLAMPRWFMVLAAGWLLSQVVTDVVVGSKFEDLARGWAAIVFTITDFAAILVLVSTPRRARLFALGLAAAGVLGYFIAPGIYAADYPWKFGFGMPVAFVLAASLSGSIGKRLPLLPISGFIFFGGLNLVLGFRNLGGISLLTAGYLLFSSFTRGQQAAPRRSLLRVGAGLALLSLAMLSVLQLYDLAASGGWLGADAQATYRAQSGNLGVLIGGRPEILVASQAVIDSPVLGHGSWAKDFTYVNLLAGRLSSFGYEVGAGPSDVGLIPTHSYLIGSWVWAGFLGAVFWLGVVRVAVWLLMNLKLLRSELAPLLVFSAMLLLWNIAFSPYGANSRLTACYGLAVCLLGLRQGQWDGDGQLPIRSAWASRPPGHASWAGGDGRAALGRGCRPPPDRAGSAP